MSQVIDLNAFKRKKQDKEAKPSTVEAADFGDRLSRIKASLEKINKLMAELQKMSRS